MGKSGCGMVANVLLLIAAMVILGQSIWGWVGILVGLGAAVGIYLYNKRTKELKFLAGLDQQALTVDAMVNGELANVTVGVALNKDESVVCVLPNIALTEYQSTGSSYSGGNVGVSFPLAGSLRGHVGGQGGSINRNPEQLMIVDLGQAIFTTKRILFSGAKFVRDWELAKTVSLEPGPNGVDVKIAVSNRERTSGLRANDVYSFGPGYAAAYVFNLSQHGAEGAKKWATDLANELRTVAAVERAKKD